MFSVPFSGLWNFENGSRDLWCFKTILALLRRFLVAFRELWNCQNSPRVFWHLKTVMGRFKTLVEPSSTFRKVLSSKKVAFRLFSPITSVLRFTQMLSIWTGLIVAYESDRNLALSLWLNRISKLIVTLKLVWPHFGGF